MFVNDIFIGIILSLNYLLGFILYKWSKEEVDFILDKFKVLETLAKQRSAGPRGTHSAWELNKLILPLAVLFGIISAFFVKKTEVLLIVLLMSTIISSGTIKDKNKILLPAISFLIAFIIVYFAVLYL